MNALGVQAVDRLIEQQYLGIAEQCHGNAQALRHTQGEGAGMTTGHVGQPDHLQHFVHPPGRNVIGSGDPPQVVTRRPIGVKLLGIQQRPNLAQRMVDLVILLATDSRGPGSRASQPDDHAQRRRLTCPIGSQEPGHDARLDGYREVIDRRGLPIDLGQRPQFDHAAHYASYCTAGPSGAGLEACAQNRRGMRPA